MSIKFTVNRIAGTHIARMRVYGASGGQMAVVDLEPFEIDELIHELRQIHPEAPKRRGRKPKV